MTAPVVQKADAKASARVLSGPELHETQAVLLRDVDAAIRKLQMKA